MGRPRPVFKRDIRIAAETRPAFLIGAAIAGLVALVAGAGLPVPPWVGGREAVTTVVMLLIEWGSGCLILAVSVWVFIRFIVFDGRPKRVGHEYPWKIFGVAMAVGLALTGVRMALVTRRDVTPQLRAATRELRRTVAGEVQAYETDAPAVFRADDLRPERLAAHPQLAPLKRQVAAARRLLELRRAADAQARERLTAKLKGLKLDPERQARLMNAYEQNNLGTVGEDQEYWSMQGEALDRADDLLTNLERHPAAWRPHGARLGFSDRKVMTDYIRSGDNMDTARIRARQLAMALINGR